MIIDLHDTALARLRHGIATVIHRVMLYVAELALLIMAYVNVISSMMFGHLSGSAVADVSSLGSIVIPMMKKQGYTDDFSVGLTVTTA